MPSTPKLLIVGYSGVGKTAVGEILAELTSGKCANTSDYIIADYAQLLGLPVAEVLANKVKLRRKLYAHATHMKTKDPAYWARLALYSGANIVTGVRDSGEFDAARPLFDHAIWVHRHGYGPNETDRVHSHVADRFVFGGYEGGHWRQQLERQCYALLLDLETEL